MTETQETTAPEYEHLALDALHDNPENVREKVVKDEAYRELVASIKSRGVIEPLLVVPREDDKGFMVVAGHRRRAAAVDAGLTLVPTVVHYGLGDSEITEMALIENLMRADLNPVEEARAYFRLVALGEGRTVKSIAEATGRGAKYVSERLALMELPKPVLARVAKGDISLAATKFLRDLIDAEVPKEVFDNCVDRASGGANIEHEVARALSTHTRSQVLSEITEKCEARGVPFYLHQGPVYDLPRQYASLDGKVAGLDTPTFTGAEDALVAHKKEPCHGVLVVAPSYGSTKPISSAACLDLKRHSAKGDSELKVEKRQSSEAEDAQRERNRAEREANAARKTHRISLLQDIEGSGKAVTSKVAERAMAYCILSSLSAEAIRRTCEGLTLEPAMVPDAYGAKTKTGEPKMVKDHWGPIAAYVEESHAKLQRAALVGSVAALEDNYGSGVAEARAAVNELTQHVSQTAYEPAWEMPLAAKDGSK